MHYTYETDTRATTECSLMELHVENIQSQLAFVLG